MTAKTSPARRAAFMAAVAATGNRTLAAERAKVSPSWVTLHRKTDPAFRAELDAAMATARATLTAQRSAPAGMAPAAGLRTTAGEELVVRGGNGRRTQIARARLRQWTPRIEARFLDALAACCNVRAACAAVGLSVPSAYNHRARWSSFRARWDAALAIGYERIEGAVIEAACMLFGPGGGDRDENGDGDGSERAPLPELAIIGMTVEAALQALWLHQHQVRGVGKAPGMRPRARDMDKMYVRLERSIARVERRYARGAAAEAAAQRETARALAHGVAVVHGLGDAAPQAGPA